MKNIKILLLAVILVLLSLYIPSLIRNREEMSAVHLGYPIHFIQQDISSLSWGEIDSAPFPQRASFVSPWEYPFNFNWLNFIASILIVFGLLFLVKYFLFKKSLK